MNLYQQLTRLRRLGIWHFAVLCLISGIFLHPKAAEGQTPAKPEPDVLIFTNGDQLTGTLERGMGDSLIFKSDLVGEITVPMDKVKELRSSGKFAMMKKTDKVTRTSNPPGTISYADNVVSVTSPSGTSTSAVKDMAYLVDEATYNKEVRGNPGIWYGWKGSVSGGASILRSTQNGTTFNAGLTLAREIPTVSYLPTRTRTTVNVLESYGKLTTPDPPFPDSEVKTNIFHADAEHDRYFSPRVYALVGASFDHNFSQGLNFQQIYGAGVGWTVIQRPVEELDVKADVHYERQNFLPPTATPDLITPNQDLIGSTFAENYHRNLPAKLIFTESGSYIQSWNNFHAYSAIMSAGLQLPVYKRFSLNVNALDNYLNNPAVGFKKNSFQFITGVLYTLP